MDSAGKVSARDGRNSSGKRRRGLISCTECHRRKQKCDRHCPCQNCVKRCKPDLCRFRKNDSKTCDSSTTNANLASSSESNIVSLTPCRQSQLLSKSTPLSSHDNKHLADILGYSTHNDYSTFSLVSKAGATDPITLSSPGSADAFHRKQTALDDRYRSLVRQLPSNEYIDILVQQFFSEINWQYDVLDKITFHRQLRSWRRHPYSAHNQAISSLPADILAFPSLVAQVIAHALIHQPGGDLASSSLESLKYAAGMTFVDLAHDLSEAGHSTIETIKKTGLSVVAVQSGLLRASFLKNIGSVIEAWHVIGTTIRNAQEIGLHAGVAAKKTSVSVDTQWDDEMRRRVWFVLHNWDIHMAVVLGRPITTMMTSESVDLPDDFVQRESGELPRRRTDQDAPTPFSVIRVGYDTSYRYFSQIRELENRGAKIEDYHIVRETHAAIIRNVDRIPRWCYGDNPNVRFDGFSSCHWLPAARQSLMSGIYFVLLSLHRPYIFSVYESRTEALKAALTVLAAQRRLFYLSDPKKYLTFNMIYPLFDAMVISLAILVLFPNEKWDFCYQLLEAVHWGINILAKVGQQNATAHSANNVLRTLLSRLPGGYRDSLQHLNHNDHEGATERLGAGTGAADLHAPAIITNTCFTTDKFDASNLIETSPPFSRPARPSASTLSECNVETLLPPRPTSDLFYQDTCAPAPETLSGFDLPTEFVQFDGDHSYENFWSFINDLDHL